MSEKKAGIIVVIAVVLLVFVVVMFAGCSLEKTVPQEGTMGVVPGNEVVVVNNTTGYEGNTGNVGVVEETVVIEKETESKEVLKNEGYTVDIGEIEDINKNKDERRNLTLVPVDDVVVKETFTSDVLISGKNMYLLDDSIYAYSLNMVLPINGSGKGLQVVDYMCSVTTWNSVESGESIKVEYGIDENGKIVVLSLSKW